MTLSKTDYIDTLVSGLLIVFISMASGVGIFTLAAISGLKGVGCLLMALLVSIFVTMILMGDFVFISNNV